jgi:hypothetical protein
MFKTKFLMLFLISGMLMAAVQFGSCGSKSGDTTENFFKEKIASTEYMAEESDVTTITDEPSNAGKASPSDKDANTTYDSEGPAQNS